VFKTYSKTASCVSDGRTRAILAAVRSPRLLLDRLEQEKNKYFNSILLFYKYTETTPQIEHEKEQNIHTKIIKRLIISADWI